MGACFLLARERPKSGRRRNRRFWGRGQVLLSQLPSSPGAFLKPLQPVRQKFSCFLLLFRPMPREKDGEPFIIIISPPSPVNNVPPTTKVCVYLVQLGKWRGGIEDVTKKCRRTCHASTRQDDDANVLKLFSTVLWCKQQERKWGGGGSKKEGRRKIGAYSPGEPRETRRGFFSPVPYLAVSLTAHTGIYPFL